MNIVTSVTVIGDISAESIEHKTVKDKALTEFKVQGCGLRISAWEARASQVPDSGRVVVQGYLATRQYTYENQQRETTEIRATNIQTLDTAPAVDADLPF